MDGWSAWSEWFDVPGGSLDVYQSLQSLAPGACVGAHTHDGPENGLVVSGTLSRWEAGTGERRFAAGESFVTPAGRIHATANAAPADGEHVTLHILARGAAFAHAWPGEAFTQPAPGSTRRVRVYFANNGLGARIRTRHTFIVVEDECRLPRAPASFCSALRRARYCLTARG